MSEKNKKTKSMEEILLTPLDIPVGDIKISKPLVDSLSRSSGEIEGYTLFSTRVETKAFTPCKESLYFFAPEPVQKDEE